MKVPDAKKMSEPKNAYELKFTSNPKLSPRIGFSRVSNTAKYQLITKKAPIRQPMV